MGLILDSSALIGAEQLGKNARQALEVIAQKAPGEEIAVSVITAIELAHGVARANTPERKFSREQFLNELLKAVPVYPVTISIALRTGQVDGQNAAKGIRVALADLLIGITALELGYRVLTANVRHFKMIPGLEIVAV